MLPLRLVVAILLLGTGVAGAGAAYVAFQQGSAPGAAGVHAVEIVGPDGVLFAGEVRVETATALSVLERAADAAGLPLAIDRYPGMGAYVRAVGDHEAHGASGWVFAVARDGGWVNGDRSGERFALQSGDAVRWSWTSG